MKEYEPYYKLLFAIYNSDEIKKSDDARIITIIAYDIKNSYLPIGVFAGTKSAASFFRTSRENISCDINRKTIKYGQIVLERVTKWKKKTKY